MLAETDGIATKHAVLGIIIAVYLIGGFALRLWAGLCTPKHERMDETVNLFTWIWPLWLPVEIILMCCETCWRAIMRSCLWQKVLPALDIATLPFRPFALGQRMAQIRQEKSKAREINEKGTTE